jgi:hypothetical protein
MPLTNGKIIDGGERPESYTLFFNCIPDPHATQPRTASSIYRTSQPFHFWRGGGGPNLQHFCWVARIGRRGARAPYGPPAMAQRYGCNDCHQKPITPASNTGGPRA